MAMVGHVAEIDQTTNESSRTIPNNEIIMTAAAIDSHAPARVASVRSLRTVSARSLSSR